MVGTPRLIKDGSNQTLGEQLYPKCFEVLMLSVYGVKPRLSAITKE
jgi:hypothetical protein